LQNSQALKLQKPETSPIDDRHDLASNREFHHPLKEPEYNNFFQNITMFEWNSSTNTNNASNCIDLNAFYGVEKQELHITAASDL
jgi:hypothetical protein